MLQMAGALLLSLMCVSVAQDEIAALGRARAAVKKKDFKKARAELSPVLKASDPKVRIDGLMLAADVELAARQPQDAVQRLVTAMGVADDSELPPSTFKKLHARALSTAKKAKLAERVTLLESVTTADKLLAQGEKWPLLPERLENDALAPITTSLESLKALRLKRRVWKAEMLVALASVDVGLADSVVKSVPEAWKVKALRVAARVRVLAAKEHTDQKLVEKVVQLCSEADALDPALASTAATYRRSATTTGLCNALAPGACRKAEERLGLRPTMTDFSTGSVLPVLTDESIAKTHGEYSFLLERCLRDAMMRDDLLRGVQFELSWAVQPTGLPSDIQIEPRRYREHPGSKCLGKMIETFRYQRSRSEERRVVTMTMNVAR